MNALWDQRAVEVEVVVVVEMVWKGTYDMMIARVGYCVRERKSGGKR